MDIQASPKSKKLIKVMVVEDDRQDFILINQALKSSVRVKYETEHVSAYNQAVNRLMDSEYDVILVDYFLGDETGFELLRRAQEAHIDKPIIVMTGNTAAELDDMLIKAGAADFIPKDEINSSMLDRSIRHAIERKTAELEIARLVRRDPLTGLGNRFIFEEHMELAIARAGRNKSRLAVIFMDLDRFKDVNDTLGHHVGDLLLTLVGDRLRRLVRKSDFVARIGGDEFTVLLDDIQGYHDVEKIVSKIIEGVGRPAPVSNTTLDISVSIGVAIYPDNGSIGIELMQKADMALYESKALGPGHFHFFTESLQERLVQGLEIERGLKEAISSSQLELYYQPQIDLETNDIVGLEALVRWNHPERGVIPPIEFIPVATKSGLIIPMGEWVLEEACRQMAEWNDMGYKVPVSVNVSPKQLKYRGFFDNLMQTISDSGIDAGDLEIELTEEVFIESGTASFQMFNTLRNLGIKISIDDFGTGYSSMRYLKEIPLDRIKIDRSFISEKGAGSICDPAITRAIISLAEGLKLEVIAEGLETEQHVMEIKDQGCLIGQGFYFYKPLTVQAVNRLLESRLRPSLSASALRG
ncbi:GGDEF domain-containing response regulator [Hahella sp. CCB-MM4]|uniref:EAL domain-containing response regulator n=1 Tax=Hahella sp. (strain CCB-MM4) TaxID=1926491 RepID=UPI000B9BB13E|nr:GGDEF domain-containing response regulator [Hahella sp. CCB-MM4]OZG74885.1 GGDEF domain-containing response regulator [Hahella sp. CCB-MM4]